MQDLPALVPEDFSDTDPGDEEDEDDVFTFPSGMTELVCELPTPTVLMQCALYLKR